MTFWWWSWSCLNFRWKMRRNLWADWSAVQMSSSRWSLSLETLGRASLTPWTIHFSLVEKCSRHLPLKNPALWVCGQLWTLCIKWWLSTQRDCSELVRGKKIADFCYHFSSKVWTSISSIYFLLTDDQELTRVSEPGFFSRSWLSLMWSSIEPTLTVSMTISSSFLVMLQMPTLNISPGSWKPLPPAAVWMSLCQLWALQSSSSMRRSTQSC